MVNTKKAHALAWLPKRPRATVAPPTHHDQSPPETRRATCDGQVPDAILLHRPVVLPAPPLARLSADLPLEA